MGDDELDEVEAALGRKFPAAYRRFIRTYSLSEGAHCGVYLYAHPKDLLRANRLMERRPDEQDGGRGECECDEGEAVPDEPPRDRHHPDARQISRWSRAASEAAADRQSSSPSRYA